jgi:hypothetical protein
VSALEGTKTTRPSAKANAPLYLELELKSPEISTVEKALAPESSNPIPSALKGANTTLPFGTAAPPR